MYELTMMMCLRFGILRRSDSLQKNSPEVASHTSHSHHPPPPLPALCWWEPRSVGGWRLLWGVGRLGELPLRQGPQRRCYCSGWPGCSWTNHGLVATNKYLSLVKRTVYLFHQVNYPPLPPPRPLRPFQPSYPPT